MKLKIKTIYLFILILLIGLVFVTTKTIQMNEWKTIENDAKSYQKFNLNLFTFEVH